MLGHLRLLVLGSLVATTVACGAPSSFEGLVGGSKEDASLAAPRPMSPLSVTMVSTSRPRFKWENFGKATGAIVELCKTRDFAAGTVKSFETDGRELVVPEDLEAGIWFWRLLPKGSGTVGTERSPIWEVLVRGPAAHGASETPVGGIVDLDADGRPELVTSAEMPMMQGDTFPWTSLLVYPTIADGTLSTENVVARGTSYAMTNIAQEKGFIQIAGGLDYDGDGLGDLVYAGLERQVDPTYGDVSYSIVMESGGAFDPNVGPKSQPLRVQPYPDDIPTLAPGGDLNGDGYGDLLVGDPALVTAAYGGKNGPAANLVVSFSAVAAPGSPSRVVAGSFDIDGDGIGDMLFGPGFAPSVNGTSKAPSVVNPPPSSAIAGEQAYEVTTTTLALGSSGMTFDRAKFASLSNGGDVRSRVLTSGDLDGDGIQDLVTTVAAGTLTNVCVFFGNREKGFLPGPCANGLDGDTAFGGSLTTADLEGDGLDEVLATATNGGSVVRVLRLVDNGSRLDVAPIGKPGFGKHLTTVWPGRPGKARWAALNDDGESLGVFDGGELSQTLRAPRYAAGNFGRALR